ncbi:MAG: hypothetical protein EOO39_24820, partial [Cytophagaceae bacterium]
MACTGDTFTYAGSLTTDGVTTFAAKQVNGFSQQATASVSWTRDTVAPVIALISPATGTALTTTSVTLTGNCEAGNSQVSFTGDGLSSAASAPCSAGTFSQSVSFTSGSGTKAVIISQTDDVGNVGSTNATYPVSISSVAPVYLYIGAFPVEGSKHLAANAIRVRLILEQNGDSVTACYRVDGGPCTSVVPNTDLSLNGLSTGAHTIAYEVTSFGVPAKLTKVKNFSVAASYSGNQGPDVEILNPHGPSFDLTLDTERNVYAIASDPENALRDFTIKEVASNVVIAKSSAGDLGMTKVNATFLPPLGASTLRATARDIPYVTVTKDTAVSLNDATVQIPASLNSFTDITPTRWNHAYMNSVSTLSFHQNGVVNDLSNPGNEFSWIASYQMRAFLTMAKLTGGKWYMNRARVIARMMNRYTEKHRNDRGELPYMNPSFYYTAGPLYYLKTPGVPVKGWLVAEGSPAMLIDGHNCNHLMRYVDLAKEDARFADYSAEAEELIDTVEEVLADWNSNWKENRFATAPLVAAAYYYPKSRSDFAAGGELGDGTYSGPQALNHHGTFISAGIRLNHYRPGVLVDYKDRAAKYISVFKMHSPVVN